MMNIKNEYYDMIDFDNQQQYQNNEKVNRGGRKQVKVGTTKRNARERNRVRYINQCFDVLRQHIPAFASIPSSTAAAAVVTTGDDESNLNRKLSKVETLKFAAKYIRQLTMLLQETETETECENQQIMMLSPSTSPFSSSSSSSSSCSNQQSTIEQPHYQHSNYFNSSCDSNYYPPPATSAAASTNITLNNININIYNESTPMQVDSTPMNQQCSYHHHHQQSFMEQHNQYHYQCYF